VGPRRVVGRLRYVEAVRRQPRPAANAPVKAMAQASIVLYCPFIRSPLFLSRGYKSHRDFVLPLNCQSLFEANTDQKQIEYLYNLKSNLIRVFRRVDLNKILDVHPPKPAASAHFRRAAATARVNRLRVGAPVST